MCIRDSSGTVRETRIVSLPRVLVVPQRVAVTNTAALQRQRAVDAAVWTSHTRDRDTNRLDPAHVLTGVIDVKQRLRQGHETLTRLLQLHQAERIDRKQ